MNFTIEKVLIIEYSSLPKEIKIEVEKLYGFGNDRYINFDSEFHYYGDSFKTSITLENYNQAVENNPNLNFSIEKFLIDSQIDFINVGKILFHICW